MLAFIAYAIFFVIFAFAWIYTISLFLKKKKKKKPSRSPIRQEPVSSEPFVASSVAYGETPEEALRREMIKEGEQLRATGAPREQIRAIDDALGRSMSERDFEDEKMHYHEPNYDGFGEHHDHHPEHDFDHDQDNDSDCGD